MMVIQRCFQLVMGEPKKWMVYNKISKKWMMTGGDVNPGSMNHGLSTRGYSPNSDNE